MGVEEEDVQGVVNRRLAGCSRLAAFSLFHTDSALSIPLNKLWCGDEPCQPFHLESHPHMFLGLTKVRGLAGSPPPYPPPEALHLECINLHLYKEHCPFELGWLWQTKPRSCPGHVHAWGFCAFGLRLVVADKAQVMYMEIPFDPPPFGLGWLWWTKPQGKV